MASYDDRFYDKYYHPGCFEYLVMDTKDSPKEPIVRLFEETNMFIARGRQNGGVYVHCLQGVSRGPSAVAAYLVAEEGLGLGDALKLLARARPQVRPNEGFVRQLQLYAVELGRPA
eukprot:CAMPEP_0113671588 /NCGR_PEP_ID=MMETSP0038_2-20120614/5785_1 /TAXON_ID=2898 /ORGANISM="Cryptomonas paramecium" /LENGTH=115 /DNA_ID=CAMNT_0000587751 /DNA_START=224 /DNA_END=568 /DNA_ORIENTATION=- /assembly_acc=CAM_ASM_000170